MSEVYITRCSQLLISRLTGITSSPTGELAPVGNTPYNFTSPKTIGSGIAAIKNTDGYDIDYVLRGSPGELRFAAKVDDPSSGRDMEVWTTEPGLQFYNANQLAEIGER